MFIKSYRLRILFIGGNFFYTEFFNTVFQKLLANTFFSFRRTNKQHFKPIVFSPHKCDNFIKFIFGNN